MLQQVPPVLYIVEAGTVGFEALDHAHAPCEPPLSRVLQLVD